MHCQKKRVCGAMDNASAYGAEDSRFDPWQTRHTIKSYHAFQIVSSQWMDGLIFSLPAD